MSLTPYTIHGTVTLSSVAQANLLVTIRNERTNQSGTATTDSSGNYVYSLSNITSGWTVGDVITSRVLYSSYDAEASHTIASGEGGYTLDLALSAISVGNLRYFAVQDFLDFHAMTLGDGGVPTAEHIVKIGIMAEKEIDSRCNTVFDSNSGSYYTVTDEYLDVKKFQEFFFLAHKPVIAITTLSANTADQDAAASWTDLTEDTDFETDLATGRISLMMDQESNTESYPARGSKQLKCTYTYGRATVPEDIKMLAVLLTTKKFMLSAVGKSIIAGNNDFNFASWTEINREMERTTSRYYIASIVNT